MSKRLFCRCHISGSGHKPRARHRAKRTRHIWFVFDLNACGAYLFGVQSHPGDWRWVRFLLVYCVASWSGVRNSHEIRFCVGSRRSCDGHRHRVSTWESWRHSLGMNHSVSKVLNGMCVLLYDEHVKNKKKRCRRRPINRSPPSQCDYASGSSAKKRDSRFATRLLKVSIWKTLYATDRAVSPGRWHLVRFEHTWVNSADFFRV